MKKILFLLIAFFTIQSCSKEPLAKLPPNPTTPTTPVSAIPQNLDVLITATNIDSIKLTLFDSVAGNIDVVLLDTVYRNFNNNPSIYTDTFKYHISGGYRIHIGAYTYSETQVYFKLFNTANGYKIIDRYTFPARTHNFYQTLKF